MDGSNVSHIREAFIRAGYIGLSLAVVKLIYNYTKNDQKKDLVAITKNSVKSGLFVFTVLLLIEPVIGPLRDKTICKIRRVVADFLKNTAEEVAPDVGKNLSEGLIRGLESEVSKEATEVYNSYKEYYYDPVVNYVGDVGDYVAKWWHYFAG